MRSRGEQRVFVAVVLLWLLHSLALAQSGQAGVEYRIAPGDRISISVYGEPDLTFADLPIPSNGSITYPFLGQVQTINKTEVELARDITLGLLDGYLLQPQVTVAVTRYRPIFVGGAVKIPGQKEYSVGMDVERLIALGGGFSDSASQEEIVIQRKTESSRFELTAGLATEVLPGDVVTVGEKILEQKLVSYFYLEGEVNSPGQYEYTEGLSVQKAIAIAGGFSLRASRKKISITRSESQERLNKVNLEEPILPGDVISIGASLF
ncbi:MAG: SLBB domain-containing protein [bacterium]